MKKTNKVHPITAFRKANEARQSVVKKSMKKAQDGIETNDDMINKAGSKGGYKSPSPWGSINNPLLDRVNKFPYQPKMSLEPNTDNVKEANAMRGNGNANSNLKDERKKRINKAYMDALINRPKSDTPMMDSLYPKKKGGAVKRKK